MDADISHDAAIAAVSLTQQGNITRAQLLDVGLSDGTIGVRVRAGRLHRAYAGVYGVGRPPRTPLERASAAVLACGPGAALSHSSAMTLWGLSKRWKTPFEVVVTTDRRPKGITVHRSTSLSPRDFTRHHGIRVTTPARTLLDNAPKLTQKRLARAVNDALHSRYLHHSDLENLLTRLPRHPGAAHLRRFVANPTGITRSVLEDTFVVFCADHDLPIPLLNVPIAGYRVDAYFPNERLIVELDSYEFHSDRHTFESDRNRDADTLLAGLLTVRITHERMTRIPDLEASRLHAILEARRRALNPASGPDRDSPPRT